MSTVVALYNEASPGDELTFPVTPTGFSDDMAVEKISWKISKLGTISRPFGTSERVVAFKADLPGFQDRNQAFVQKNPATGFTGWRGAAEIVSQLRYWQGAQSGIGIKLHLSITGDRTLTMPCYITKCTAQHVGFGGAQTLDLELTEWRDFAIRLDGEAAPGPGDTTGDTPAPPAEDADYTVVDGDTLRSIAGVILGDQERWQEIYDLNVDTIGEDPDALEVGMVLHMPVTATGEVESTDDAPPMDIDQLTPDDPAFGG